ncbi:MAG: flagellar biosynthesis anti-sigma factor FlgM [Dehalococcoidia bacterium]|nr:flagellar biosynthesis anti-sigma factor FlgM [Dehalococcoidia bacterium]
MAGVRKTSGTGAARRAVYDLAGARQRATPPAAVDRVDTAGITPEARALARAIEAVEEASEVRDERVRALREQIRNGTYKPDPVEIAKKLVERGF